MMQTGKIVERLLELVFLHANGKHTVFAKKAGIPHGTFSAYIKGRVPHAEHLCRIQDTYGVNINWLLNGKGDKYIKGGDDFPIYKVKDENPETDDLLSMTRDILKSSTDYSTTLAANVRSFHRAIKTEKRLKEKQPNKMEGELTVLKNMFTDLARENEKLKRRLDKKKNIPKRKIAVGEKWT